jgi:hypothetical protein
VSKPKIDLPQPDRPGEVATGTQPVSLARVLPRGISSHDPYISVS